MFKPLPLDEFYRLINHGPCVFITSGTPDKPNIAPIAWTMPINDEPPLVGIAIAQTHYTAELINRTGEFVINIPDVELLKKLIDTGKFSGRKIDKIKKFNINLEPASKCTGRRLNADYQTPHISDAVGYIECSVFEKHIYEGVILFVGKVCYAAVKQDSYDGCLMIEKSPTAHHLGGGWFAITSRRVKF